MLQVYLKGDFCGLYGTGAVVYARRNDGDLVKGNYYTIKEVVDTGLGMCGKNLGIVVDEVPGVYTRNDFRVTESCIEKSL